MCIIYLFPFIFPRNKGCGQGIAIIYDVVKVINNSKISQTFPDVLTISENAEQFSFVKTWHTPILYFDIWSNGSI
jgi:hypothetical protein